DEALTKLAAADKTAADLVQLRYFAGLTLPEAARVLGVSARTAGRLWSYARAWLRQEIEGQIHNFREFVARFRPGMRIGRSGSRGRLSPRGSGARPNGGTRQGGSQRLKAQMIPCGYRRKPRWGHGLCRDLTTGDHPSPFDPLWSGTLLRGGPNIPERFEKDVLP